MPKMKTNRAAAKRFKRTKNGRFKRGKAYSSHIFTSKTTKRKRRLRQGGYVAHVDENRIGRLLPYS
ncbi:MAG: 50S ribosomal protein L35 [candidate division Zixibacteria bacterium]|nr:50S ribosomal protein L35 [candidate division Zixibacteria bacterium]